MKRIFKIIGLIIFAPIFFLMIGPFKDNGGYYQDVYLKKKKRVMKKHSLSEEEYEQVCREAIVGKTEITLKDGRKLLITRS